MLDQNPSHWRFQIVSVLGSGGSSKVFRAQDLITDSLVALKVVPWPERRLLVSEFRLLRKLRHPGLVAALDLLLEEPEAMLSLELLQPLDVRQFRARSEVKKLLKIWQQLAAVLGHMHRRGLVHGDLKPENIGFVGEQAKLLDLGFCLRGGNSSGGEFTGTPLYASPEMLMDNRRLPAGDIYSLGLVIWELAGGRRPEVSERLDPQNRWLEVTPQLLPPSAVQLIKSMLNFNHLERPQDGRQLLWMMAEAGWSEPGEIFLEMPLMGRSHEMRKTIRQLEAGNSVVVGCRPGRGASRFLQELKYLLQVRGHRAVLSDPDDESRTLEDAILLKEALAAEAAGNDGQTRCRRVNVQKFFKASEDILSLSEIDRRGYQQILSSIFPEATESDVARFSHWLHGQFGGHLGLARQALEWLLAEGRIEKEKCGLRFHWQQILSLDTLLAVSNLLTSRWGGLGEKEKDILKELAIKGSIPKGLDIISLGAIAEWLKPGPDGWEFSGQAFRMFVLEKCADHELRTVGEKPGAGDYLSSAPQLRVYKRLGNWERWVDLALRVLSWEEERLNYEAIIFLGTDILDSGRLGEDGAKSVLLRVMNACRRLGCFQRGLDIWNNYGKPLAEDWDLLRWQIVLLLGAGRYRQAGEEALRAQLRWPDRFEIACQSRMLHGFALAYDGDVAAGTEEIQQALSQAQSVNNRSLVRMAYEYLANIAHMAGRWNQAAELALKGLEATGPDASLEEIDTLTSILGSSLIQGGKAAQAQWLLSDFLQKWEERLPLPELASFHAYLGLAYISLEAWSRAIEHLGQAEANLASDNLEYRAFITNNIALSLGGNEQHLTERKKYMEALYLFLALKNDANAAICLSNISLVENIYGRISEAKRYLADALQIAQRSGVRRAEAVVYKNWGLVEFEQKNYQSAREHLEKGRDILRSLDQPANFETGFYLSLANLALDDLRQSEEAIDYAAAGVGNESQKIMHRLLAESLSIRRGTGSGSAWFSLLEQLWKRRRRREAAMLALFMAEEIYGWGNFEVVETLYWLARTESYFSSLGNEEGKHRAEECILRLVRTLDMRPDRFLDRGLLDVFYTLADHLRSGAGPEIIGWAALEKAVLISQSERGGIFLIGDDGQPRLLCGVNLDQATIEDARQFSHQAFVLARKKEGGIVANDAQVEDDFQSRESIRRNSIRSLACIPFEFQDGNGGALYLDSRILPGVFSPSRREFLRAFASLIGALLDSSRMMEMLRCREDTSDALNSILGSSPLIQEMKQRIRRAAATSVNILIEGETGTGKELAARAIHQLSERRNGPFVALDCGSLPESLLEAELFGYVKGAFTGAYADKPGLFEAAHGGTMFLDEITSASPAVQARLLRVIEEGEIRRVGDTKVRKVDVRLICASNKDIEFEMGEGRFKPDLYYRLNQFKIFIPPLRDRGSDIIALAEHFRRKYMKIYKRPGLAFSDSAKRTMMKYPWPGNIRELENTIQKAVIMAPKDVITEKELELQIIQEVDLLKEPRHRRMTLSRQMMANLLRECGNNTAKVAEKLGLSRRQVQRIIKKYNIAT